MEPRFIVVIFSQHSGQCQHRILDAQCQHRILDALLQPSLHCVIAPAVTVVPINSTLTAYYRTKLLQ
ncbi:hypothetical protein TREES_T100019757 [Tupaia chinensis]|uniref:Uncharacterized protein n=1 Tax=Tupaia chinensis TaxID=246437 RepID=L9JDP3_TUPCH|nr:hypothetical protein TREES_T100019757 [Tupaia chinensis]